MGTLFKNTSKKPIPANAKILNKNGKSFAKWRDRNGNMRQGKITKDEKYVLAESLTYSARYRDAEGILRKTSTGCKDKDAAMNVLLQIEARMDKIRSGQMTPEENAAFDHQKITVDCHLEAYLKHLKAKHGKGSKSRVSDKHVKNVSFNLVRFLDETKSKYLKEITQESLQNWIKYKQQEAEPLSARTINAHIAALKAFLNWCLDSKRILINPISRFKKLDEKADRRKARRALTEREQSLLIYVATQRPLAEHGRETIKLPPEKQKGRKSWTKAPLTLENIESANAKAFELLEKKPDFRDELIQKGKERALIYKTLLLTGLRKSELASLRVKNVDLECEPAFIFLDAENDKAGRGAEIPIRDDLKRELSEWLKPKSDSHSYRILEFSDTVKRSPEDHIFNVPHDLIRVLDRDLAVAGIPKIDDRGRSIDIHALRHTFGTHLSKAGVSPRTAQAAMRHSSLDLTMNTYTDPRLLDVAGALNGLPKLELEMPSDRDRAQARRTGTDDYSADEVRSKKTVTEAGSSSQNQASSECNDSYPFSQAIKEISANTLENQQFDKNCHELAIENEKWVKGLEPSTFSLEG